MLQVINTAALITPSLLITPPAGLALFLVVVHLQSGSAALRLQQFPALDGRVRFLIA
jgi:hypothetical protein